VAIFFFLLFQEDIVLFGPIRVDFGMVFILIIQDVRHWHHVRCCIVRNRIVYLLFLSTVVGGEVAFVRCFSDLSARVYRIF
jgi:hypothetical protein